MKKYCFLILFLFLFLPLEGKRIVLFEKPEQGARYLVIDSSLVSDSSGRFRQIFTFHPLCRIYRFAEKKLPNGVSGYQRADIIVREDGKTPVRHVDLPIGRIATASCCILLLLVILFRNIYCSAAQWNLIFIPVLLRMALVLFHVEYEVFPVATDEPGYFKTMSDMLSNSWQGPWSFTVGTGFFYLPFILLAGAKEFYDIVPHFNYFSALVLAPGVLALGFLILRKFNVSAKTACAAMLMWSIYPFVSLHLEDWNTLNFQQFFHYPQWFSRFNGHFYYSFCINSGFNAMSDIPGLFLVMGCLYLVLVMPSKYRYAALFGALYGFACLVRINYILLAPLFAYVLWKKFEFRQLCTAALSSVGAFLAVFGIQLVCNTIQFGSPLTFGYILHYTQNAALDRPTAGFTWHTFSQWRNLNYLFKVNLPFFALGTAALWMMRDRYKQTVLVLLSVPVVLFFCGYSHTFCDARRFVFPAFAGLLMAVAAADMWKTLSRKDSLSVFSALFLMLTLTVPVQAYWRWLPFMLGQGVFLRLAGIIVPLLLFGVIWGFIRRKLYFEAAFVFLSALFFYAPVYVLAVGMFLLLPWVLWRNIRLNRVK